MNRLNRKLPYILSIGLLLLFGVSCATSDIDSQDHSPIHSQTDTKKDRSDAEKSVAYERLKTQAIDSLDHIDTISLEPGEVCVINENEIDVEKLDVYANAQGYTKKKRRVLDGLGFIMSILIVPQGQTVQQGISALRTKFPSQIIDANHHYTLQKSPSIQTTSLDHQRYAYQLVGWDERAMQCITDRLRIGMIDTAIDTSNPFLRRQRIHTETFLSRKTPKAPHHHGTAVATLLVGKTPGKNTGLLPQARLFVGEAFRQKPAGRVEATTWSIVRALDWLVQNGVQVINLSLGGPSNTLLTYAIDTTLRHQIAIVAAAGNTGPHGQPMFPAAHKGVIAVTALDAKLHTYRHANHGSYIAFAAPGVDIWIPTSDQSGSFQSGTSLATPFVTTALALLTQANPQWSPSQVIQHLAEQALDLGSNGRDEVFGWGLIQFPQTCKKKQPFINTHPSSAIPLNISSMS